MKLNSHNEWDTLKEIIVGTSLGTFPVVTWHSSEALDKDKWAQALNIAQTAYPKWFYEEVEEDLDGLAKTLENLGVKVYRPSIYQYEKSFLSPHWISTSNNSYNVRDLHLIVGNVLIQSPSHQPSRYFEPTTLSDIWYRYLEHGFKWICAPAARLVNSAVEIHEEISEFVTQDEEDSYRELTKGRTEVLHVLKEDEILFEAANTLRLGNDLLYLISSSGNEKGFRWLKSILEPSVKVHATNQIYKASHIDSTLLALEPGLLVANSKRVSPKNLPALFDRWRVVYFDDVVPTPDYELEFQKNIRDVAFKKLQSMGFDSNLGEMSSPWVGMNFLSVSKECVIVEEKQINLIKMLEGLGKTVVPVKMRHIYTQGGGIHCATLDTVRESKAESYF